MNSCKVSRLRRFHTTAWTLLGAFLFVLLVPWLFRKGMFWDGVVYGAISRNLAAGIGDAWHPTVTATFFRDIREQPPLGFWLQAAFFRVFGDRFWIERLYSLTTLLIGGSILLATWRWLLRDRAGASACGWLAAALWAPFGIWCYRHNMLENTMGMFTALSVYASLRALHRGRGAATWSILSGLAISAAVLSKGPVGLFPAITPAIAWITLRRTPPLPLGEGIGECTFARALWVQSGVLCVMAVSLGLMLIPPAAREYLSGYWQQQVVSSMRGEREIVLSIAGHLNIVLLLARNLGIPALIVGGLSLISRFSIGPPAGEARPTGPMWFCLLTALSASLPIALSPKQGGHYVAPSWPFFIFALVLWGMPAVVELSSRMALWSRHMLLRYGAGAVVAGTVLFSALTYGTCGRDQPIIDVVNQVGERVGPRATIAVPSESWYKFNTGERLLIHTYLYRYYQVSIWTEELAPAWGFECFRLQAPDPELVMSETRVVTPAGLEWYPLVPQPSNRMAAAESAFR
ncbi:MAG TPA: glycosyltransferase family 39 protein [Pirellulales bacterium]|nr:glycosyltransferase family 39 protein [Pirellulales bacterium]